MNLRMQGVPLKDARLLDRGHVALLRSYSITTVEEFLGQAAAVPEPFALLLGYTESEMAETVARARTLVDPEYLAYHDDFVANPPERFKTGALPPEGWTPPPPPAELIVKSRDALADSEWVERLLAVPGVQIRRLNKNSTMAYIEDGPGLGDAVKLALGSGFRVEPVIVHRTL